MSLPTKHRAPIAQLPSPHQNMCCQVKQKEKQSNKEKNINNFQYKNAKSIIMPTSECDNYLADTGLGAGIKIPMHNSLDDWSHF